MPPRELAAAGLTVGYLTLLALWTRRAERRPSPRREAWAYVLAPALYCTTASLYGNPAVMVRSGMEYLAWDMAPLLACCLGGVLLPRRLSVCQRHGLHTVADLLAHRYCSPNLGRLAAALLALCLLPYLALQLHQVSTALGQFISPPRGPAPGALAGLPRLLVTAFICLFTVLHAAKRVDWWQPQSGLMAVAGLDALLKLAVVLAVAVALGPGALAEVAAARPELLTLQRVGLSSGSTMPHASWMALSLISLLSFVLLPRQIHVMVVQNRRPAEIHRLVWIQPLYLLGLGLGSLSERPDPAQQRAAAQHAGRPPGGGDAALARPLSLRGLRPDPGPPGAGDGAPVDRHPEGAGASGDPGPAPARGADPAEAGRAAAPDPGGAGPGAGRLAGHPGDGPPRAARAAAAGGSPPGRLGGQHPAHPLPGPGPGRRRAGPVLARSAAPGEVPQAEAAPAPDGADPRAVVDAARPGIHQSLRLVRKLLALAEEQQVRPEPQPSLHTTLERLGRRLGQQQPDVRLSL